MNTDPKTQENTERPLPRGIRNNNPLNLRKSNNKWLGKIVPGSDPAFEQFASMALGIRAAMVCLRTYINRYNCRTISSIVSRWAPASENDTKSYTTIVCRQTGLFPDTAIDFHDKRTICELAQAMALVECGRVIPYPYFSEAYDMI